MATFKDKLTRWETLRSNLKGVLPEVPDLQPHHDDFQQIVDEGFTLVAQQDAAKATLQTTTEKLRQIEKRGDHAREYLAAALRKKFGVDSKQLVEFGVRPRPLGKRKARSAAKPLIVTAPAAAEAPAAVEA